MNQMQQVMQKKRALDLLDRGYNCDFNKIKINKTNTYEHEKKKFDICWEILKTNGSFITEAIFKHGKGRCDILKVSDDGIEIIEIVKSESMESIKNKMSKYPENIKFEICKVN